MTNLRYGNSWMKLHVQWILFLRSRPSLSFLTYGGDNVDSWLSYSQENESELDYLWEALAFEINCPLDQLRFIASNGTKEVLIDPKGCELRDFQKGEESLLPQITDPAFLIHEPEDANGG